MSTETSGEKLFSIFIQRKTAQSIRLVPQLVALYQCCFSVPVQWCNVFLVLSADIQTPIDVKRAALVKLKQKKFLWNSTWNQTDMAHERQLQAGCSKVNFNNNDQAKSNDIFLDFKVYV